MQELEMTGRTVEEAIDKAVHQLGVAREDVEVIILDKGRLGILGMGAEPARVRVSVKAVDEVDLAKRTIDDLLRAMGVDAAVGLSEGFAPTDDKEPGALSFNIEGEDAGLLIGRRGETLSSFQFVLNFILSRKTQSRTLVLLDVEGYRERRSEVLRSMAFRLAERAATTGRSVAMEPMPARERRIVHMALADNAKVTTESIGEGEDRKVTIVPKRTGGGGSMRRPAPSGRY